MSTHKLKADGRLAAVIEADLGPPVSESGEWLKWRCPFHSENEASLAVKGEDDINYYCFGCGATGDVLDWLMEFRNLTFTQARNELVCMANPAGNVSRNDGSTARLIPMSQPVEVKPPGTKWQAAARRYAAKCQERLWSNEGRPGLEYLRAGGLSDETIRSAGLGWMSEDHWIKPATFGLTPWRNRRSRPGKVWLPPGVVFPCKVDGYFWYIKTRRFENGKLATVGAKYPQVRGSETALYGADDLRGMRPLLLVEGERDCLLARKNRVDWLI